MAKYYYTIYGLSLRSDYEFLQFIPLDEHPEDVDIEIIYGGIDKSIYESIAAGNIAYAKDKEIWFKNQAGIFWIHDQCKINFVEYDEGTVDDASDFLPGMCLSILLWHRKMIMLHGACIRYKGKTVVISGNSGAGKSTLTTELLKRGAYLMADDVTGLLEKDDIFISYPAFPAQKLCKDQIDNNSIDVSGLHQIRYDFNKYEVPRLENFYNLPEAVDLFFRIELNDAAELSMEEVTGGEKVKVIMDSIFINWLFNNIFKFEPDDMKRCIGVSNQVKMFRICRNKDNDTLKDILDFIDNKIGE